jgi:hypothetical protein
MDIFQTAKYFDIQSFDVYDFSNSVWKLAALEGQLKKTDTFTEIWNRPTRKRLLTCAPGQEPSDPVIRVPDSGEVFMVGASHRDVWNGYYRFIAGLHLVQGAAVIHRREPAGPSNNPGWAVDTVVATTFGDAELRSSSENKDQEIEHYGSYFLFLPINTVLHRDDVVVIGGRSYFVIEFYIDSGLISARATTEPDDRINVSYVSFGAETYDTSTQQNIRASATYNVTGRMKPLSEKRSKDENVTDLDLTFMVRRAWVGFVPKVDDTITYGGKTYRVVDVAQNALMDEWYLKLGN